MPRISPLPPDEWDEELGEILNRRSPRSGIALGENNIFSTLARHPGLFRAWLPFGGHLLARGTLSPRVRELLILRTGCNLGSSYEWGQHVRIAAEAGVLERVEIDRVLEGPGASGWSDEERALLSAADELHRDSKISEPTWTALAAVFDEKALIEIAMLVGHYHMVGFALNSLEVEQDEGLEELPSG
jgi:4-carboxymuconolactone decarboxylase